MGCRVSYVMQKLTEVFERSQSSEQSMRFFSYRNFFFSRAIYFYPLANSLCTSFSVTVSQFGYNETIISVEIY